MAFKHKTYFMDKRVYDVVKHDVVGEYPFSELEPSEWLRILHHLNAHKIECDHLRRRGTTVRNLQHTVRYFLYDSLRDYLFENNEPENKLTTIASQERDLYEKARRLYTRLEEVNVSAGPSKVIWDARQKAA